MHEAGAMAFAVQAINFLGLSAVRAERPMRPAELFKMLAGLVFVVENGVRQIDFGHGVTSLLR
jgi:hypothetical protein